MRFDEKGAPQILGRCGQAVNPGCAEGGRGLVAPPIVVDWPAIDRPLTGHCTKPRTRMVACSCSCLGVMETLLNNAGRVNRLPDGSCKHHCRRHHFLSTACEPSSRGPTPASDPGAACISIPSIHPSISLQHRSGSVP